MIDLRNIATTPADDIDKSNTKEETKTLKQEIANYQDILYAQKKYSFLIIFQGLDASGKNSATKKIFRGVNPTGLKVKTFSEPTEKELLHDFLWRIHPHAPSKGMISIFNRSHYEDVLIPRLQKTISNDVVHQRFQLINAFETLLHSNETIILKFYLHISEEEQKKRFEKRLLRPDKHWKFSEKDFITSKNREKFFDYYQDIFENCSTTFPWTIVPADKKWYTRNMIARTLVNSFKELHLEYPALDVE